MVDANPIGVLIRRGDDIGGVHIGHERTQWKVAIYEPRGPLTPKPIFPSPCSLNLKFPDCDKNTFLLSKPPTLHYFAVVTSSVLIIYSFMGSLGGFLGLVYVICMWGQFYAFLSKGMSFPFCAFWRSWNFE